MSHFSHRYRSVNRFEDRILHMTDLIGWESEPISITNWLRLKYEMVLEMTYLILTK